MEYRSRDRIAHNDVHRVAIWILHRVASAEVRRARDSHDGTDASDHPAQVGRSPARFLRCREVCARTGLSRTTLWRLECQGQFPSSRKLTYERRGLAGIRDRRIDRDPCGRPSSPRQVQQRSGGDLAAHRIGGLTQGAPLSRSSAAQKNHMAHGELLDLKRWRGSDLILPQDHQSG